MGIEQAEHLPYLNLVPRESAFGLRGEIPMTQDMAIVEIGDIREDLGQEGMEVKIAFPMYDKTSICLVLQCLV